MSNVKYPRTPHLPWSLGKTDDDKTLNSTDHFNGMSLVLTVKMDGENTTMTSDKVYARSVDSADHPSRHWVKSLWSQIHFLIPEGWRVCGENLFAKHSIAYENLGSYFHVFNIWNEYNDCLSWKETLEWCELLGLHHVEALYVNFNIKDIDELHEDFMSLVGKYHEGYVIRNSESFSYKDFSKNVAKYVRANHVQTDSHWMYNSITKNGL